MAPIQVKLPQEAAHAPQAVQTTPAAAPRPFGAPAPFPFSAIVGQDDMKLAFLLAAIDPSVGGVLVFGDRGTGKSTAVRALARLLPPMRAVSDCAYNCDPAAT
jgi:magnesium chelatase subunit I